MFSNEQFLPFNKLILLQGQRQKKLQARKLREEKDEEERKKIDLEEAKFQAKRRKEAIEKAKTAQYFQTDRIKSFHVMIMTLKFMLTKSYWLVLYLSQLS